MYILRMGCVPARTCKVPLRAKIGGTAMRRGVVKILTASARLRESSGRDEPTRGEPIAQQASEEATVCDPEYEGLKSPCAVRDSRQNALPDPALWRQDLKVRIRGHERGNLHSEHWHTTHQGAGGSQSRHLSRRQQGGACVRIKLQQGCPRLRRTRAQPSTPRFRAKRRYQAPPTIHTLRQYPWLQELFVRLVLLTPKGSL